MVCQRIQRDCIATNGNSELLNKQEKQEMEMNAVFRLGTQTKAGKYLMDQEDLFCRLCKKAEETLGYVFEESRMRREDRSNCIEKITGKSDRSRM